MKSKSILFGLFLALIVFASCVSSKKYKSAVSEAEQLKSQVTELTNQVSTLQKQVSDLNNSKTAIAQEYDKYKVTCQANEEKLNALRSALKEEYNTMEKVQRGWRKQLQISMKKALRSTLRMGIFM